MKALCLFLISFCLLAFALEAKADDYGTPAPLDPSFMQGITGGKPSGRTTAARRPSGSQVNKPSRTSSQVNKPNRNSGSQVNKPNRTSSQANKPASRPGSPRNASASGGRR